MCGPLLDVARPNVVGRTVDDDSVMSRLALELVIPLRWNASRPRYEEEVAEMTAYLAALGEVCEVTAPRTGT